MYCVGWPLYITTHAEFVQRANCTVLFGSLEIKDVVWSESLPRLGFQKISGYLVVSGVRGFRMLSHLLPNLTIVYGKNTVSWSRSQGTIAKGPLEEDFIRVSLVIADTTLQSIDLQLYLGGSNLATIKGLQYVCPAAVIVSNPLMCGLGPLTACEKHIETHGDSNGKLSCSGRVPAARSKLA